MHVWLQKHIIVMLMINCFHYILSFFFYLIVSLKLSWILSRYQETIYSIYRLKKNHLCCKVSVLVSPVGIKYKSMRKGWSCWAFFNDYVVPVQWHFKISAKKFYFFVDRYILWYVDYPVKKSPRLVLVKNNKPVNVCSQNHLNVLILDMSDSYSYAGG